jgi:large subunit ribosomal protein L2
MSLIKKNPTTPSQRQLIDINRSELSKSRPYKKLTIGLSKTGGRNNLGRITSFHKGGGHKQKYRIIDFKRKEQKGLVIGVEYDPNRSSFIALIKNDITNDHFYILSPKDLKKGDVVESNKENLINKVGNGSLIRNIPVGTLIHNISLKSNKGGQLIRSAGTFAQLIQKDIDSNKAKIKLSSGEIKLISLDCHASVGIVSNLNHKNKNLGKAGRSRWLNKRPTVRGVAMNPVDHPHGGGEGKTSGGRPSVTPWGFLTKGKKTRSVKKNK